MAWGMRNWWDDRHYAMISPVICFIVEHLQGKQKHWLVVWNINFIFPYIGNFIIPTDWLIFFRGVGIPPIQWLSIPCGPASAQVLANGAGHVLVPLRHPLARLLTGFQQAQMVQFNTLQLGGRVWLVGFRIRGLGGWIVDLFTDWLLLTMILICWTGEIMMTLW